MSRYRSADDLLEEIDLSLSPEGVDQRTLIGDLRGIAAASPRTGSDRFYNQLFGGRDDPAVAGDLLATILNNSMYTYKAAGVHALIERELVDRMSGMVGFHDGEGVFAPGGSVSNLQAMTVARNEVLKDAREKGITGESTPRVYVSDEGHYSVRKMAQICGIGRENTVAVPTDDRGRMDPDALDRLIADDRAQGMTPVMVVLTCGTTVLGAFDPIPEIVRVAHRHGAWAHIDAAFGGSVILSRKHRRLMRGCEQSDSITWDAHKMMGVPLVSSVFLTRKKGVIFRNFTESASYLFQEDTDELNFGTRALQCGRRNDCLKLWSAWKYHGDSGYEQRVNHLFDLAGACARMVKDDPALTLTKEPESVNVTFEVTGKGSAAICEHLRKQDRLVLGWGVVDGRRVIRVPFVNAELTEENVRTMLDEVKGVARTLGRQDNAVDAHSPYACAT